jgi:hypothetical protein
MEPDNNRKYIAAQKRNPLGAAQGVSLAAELKRAASESICPERSFPHQLVLSLAH